MIKKTTRIRYNKELLQEVCERDYCKVDFDKLGKCNRDTRIDFICGCGKRHQKSFTMMYRFGALCDICTKELKIAKRKKTSLEIYGTENPSQNKEVKNKITNSFLQIYGTKNPNQNEGVKNKKRQTNLKRLGVPYPFQSEKVREKSRQFYRDNYGVENVSQIGLDKQSYKLKNFTFPCGTTIKVQGYEPFLLDILVKEGYTFGDIVTRRIKVPAIWYIKDNKECRYFCDIYIPRTNTIYEVKSTWTYQKDIEEIALKREACIRKGYNFQLFVFDAKGNRQLLD